jgi:hypothetical protein
MRAKTLFLTAAAALVSFAVTAQVVSVNVVGFVNVSLPVGYTLLENPLDAGTNNTIAGLFPAPAGGTTIFKWNAVTHLYEGPFTYDADLGWDPPTVTTTSLNPGEGFWIQSATAQQVTFVGEVKQGTLSTPLYAGYNMVGSQVPQKGLMATDLKFAPQGGDVIYRYQNPPPALGQVWQISSYDADLGWDPFEPTNNIAEAVFINRAVNGFPWTRTFSVAP